MAKNLIRRSEALRLNAYRCPSGKLTIGYGHTRGVKEGDRITTEQAEALLSADVAIAMTDLERAFPGYEDLKPAQQAALISFIFNSGLTEDVMKSQLRKKFLAGNFVGVGAEFTRWIYGRAPDGSKVKLAGLVKRRAEEAKLWTSALS